MVKKQKAQGIVEFALILPLFLLFFIGITYFGFAFSDYLTINNTVRSIAHEASMQTNTKDYDQVVERNVKDVKLVSDIFEWKPEIVNVQHTENIKVNYDINTHSVYVDTQATFNKNSAIGSIMYKILNYKDGNAPKIHIKYGMYTQHDVIESLESE